MNKSLFQFTFTSHSISDRFVARRSWNNKQKENITKWNEENSDRQPRNSNRRICYSDYGRSEIQMRNHRIRRLRTAEADERFPLGFSSFNSISDTM